MTATQHVDEQTLISAATDPLLRHRHIEVCSECQRELTAWRRIADIAQDAVASAPPPGEDLADRILASISATPQESRSSERPIRQGRGHARGHAIARPSPWLAAAIVAVLVVVAVVIAFSVDSVAPSSAAVLAKIRHTPTAVASASKSVDESLYSTVRARDGVVVMIYRGRGVYSPQTNAFQFTVATAYPGQHSSSSTYSSDGSLVYIPCNLDFELIGQKPCLAYPVQGGSASDRLSVSLLRNARGPVTNLGERTIDGAETTGYRLIVPATAFVAGAEPSVRSLLGQELATTRFLHMNVWSDNRGLPVELDYTLSYRTTSPPALLTETVHERLHYSETAPRIKVPSSNELLVVPNLKAAEQHLSSYRADLQACGGTERCGVDSQG
jgi:hypothetical protein